MKENAQQLCIRPIRQTIKFAFKQVALGGGPPLVTTVTVGSTIESAGVLAAPVHLNSTANENQQSSKYGIVIEFQPDKT